MAESNALLSLRHPEMKNLESRTWYVLTSLGLSAVLMLGIWKASELPLSLASGAAFLFATLGLWQAIHKLLALALIKIRPSLGAI